MNSHDYIEKYFEGTLTAEEQQTFERLLLTDAEIATDFKHQKQLKTAITLNERAALKAKLKSFESETKKPVTYKIWYTAASILLLCGLGYYFTMTLTSGLYNEYYQTYPNVVAPTVRGESTDDLKSKAFYEYDTGQYEKSLDLFSKLYDEQKEAYALFYKAVCLMELQKYKPAIAIFNQFDGIENKEFEPFAKWYKAIAYLKIGEKQKSISILKELKATKNPQQVQAKKLLSELE